MGAGVIHSLTRMAFPSCGPSTVRTPEGVRALETFMVVGAFERGRLPHGAVAHAALHSPDRPSIASGARCRFLRVENARRVPARPCLVPGREFDRRDEGFRPSQAPGREERIKTDGAYLPHTAASGPQADTRSLRANATFSFVGGPWHRCCSRAYRPYHSA